MVENQSARHTLTHPHPLGCKQPLGVRLREQLSAGCFSGTESTDKPQSGHKEEEIKRRATWISHTCTKWKDILPQFRSKECKIGSFGVPLTSALFAPFLVEKGWYVIVGKQTSEDFLFFE